MNAYKTLIKYLLPPPYGSGLSNPKTKYPKSKVKNLIKRQITLFPDGINLQDVLSG